MDYASIYLNRYIYGNLEEEPDIVFADIPTDYIDIIDPIKDKIQSDTKLSSEKMDLLFEEYQKSVRSKTTFKSILKKNKNQLFTYSVIINGISLKCLINNLKKNKKNRDLYQYFSEVISKNEKREENIIIALKFREINGIIKLDSKPMNLAKLYLAFYIGEKDFLKIKKIIQDFGKAIDL